MSLKASGRRILVIDDDLAIRVLLHAVLRRVGFEVVLAEDGQVGLDKLAGSGSLAPSTYDLILLDLMMPRVNGYEFLEKLASVPLQSKPHVIVFTAAGQRGVAKIPDNSICRSILKPFDLETFLQMISECIDGHPVAPVEPSSTAAEL